MEIFELGDLALASGEMLPDARLAYQTFGELNAEKDNAILFTTFLGAPAEVLNGWIGEGRALDPTRHFIILPGHFGLPPSSAPSTTEGGAGGDRFPAVSISDDVDAQHRLVTEVFGIERLELVLGWSIGAIQVYDWAVRHPDAVAAIAPIAGAPTPPPWTKLWLQTVVEESIERASDGQTGLTDVAHGSALTAPPRTFYYDGEDVWRTLGFGSVAEFVSGFWEAFWLPQDPADVLVQARKARTSYPGPADATLAELVGTIKARATVAAFTGDNLFPPAESRRIASLIPGAEFREIESVFGHLATFGLSEQDVKAIDGVIRDALGD
jgi:homoserine O-acetyltransferase/O-succinyltransferase